MLRWDVGGLPVTAESDKLVGIITYSDLLREFVARAK
jgi:CBS domain-containing protein